MSSQNFYQDLYVPKCRSISSKSFHPSVHWASHQQVPQWSGHYRRLYDFELMYVTAGEMQVHFVDMELPLDYYAGDLLFIPSGISHKVVIPKESGARLLGVHFDFYDEFEVDSDIGMVVDEQQLQQDNFCIWPVNEQNEWAFHRKYQAVPLEIVKGMELVTKEMRLGMIGCEMICQGVMLQVIASLIRCQTTSDKTIPISYIKAFMYLENELQQAYDDSWTVGRMAQLLNVSEDHFIRLFKEFFGKTPYQYLQHIRYQEAKRCLLETDMKIEAIAKHIGYESLHNFSHAFKKWQGVSPREFRLQGNIF